MKYAKLNRLAFGICVSIFWGLTVLIFGLWSINTGKEFLLIPYKFYPGFSATTLGVFIAFFWALVEGYLAGFLFAALYNYIVWLIEIKRKDRAFIASQTDKEEG